MNEDVFLVFVHFALIAIGAAVWLFREWESNFNWQSYRASSFIWIVMTALVVAGFINRSDSELLLGIWIALSLFFVFRVLRVGRNIGEGRKLAWMLLMALPVSGWILYRTRFPHFHGIDAEAARLNLTRNDLRPQI
ncbi:MAG: hypothetical protein O3A92_14550 [Verrucomicrobia bacterium]|nr:hypothetical protein [Verrucomicrobiota bacterium]